jgi:hypothetical protein
VGCAKLGLGVVLGALCEGAANGRDELRPSKADDAAACGGEGATPCT